MAEIANGTSVVRNPFSQVLRFAANHLVVTKDQSAIRTGDIPDPRERSTR